MVPPIAAISFVRLLCGICSADVALLQALCAGQDGAERTV